MSTGDDADPVDPEWREMQERQKELEGRFNALHQSVVEAIADIEDALGVLDRTLRELKATKHLLGPKKPPL